MEVYWYADRNGINDIYVKVTERSSIDLPMTLRLFIKILVTILVTGVCWYADLNDNFIVKVIERFCYIILHKNDAR